MKKKVNLYLENNDMQFMVERGIDWDSLIPLIEDGFNGEDCPFTSVEEAKEFYGEVLTLVGEIAGTSIKPRAGKIDKEGNSFRDGVVTLHPDLEASLRELADSALYGMAIDRKYGGQNMSSVVLMLTTELLSAADSSIMTVFALTDGVAETIERFGDEKTKNELLPKLVTGEYDGNMALTEDNAGSDLGAITCRAIRNGDGWLLNGNKHFITNGPADISLVLARTDEAAAGTTEGLSLFACKRDEHVEIISLEDKLGIKGSPTTAMVFNNAPAVLLGVENQGFKHMLTLMNMARLGVAAQATGIAQAALNEALAYAADRKQFGVSIKNHALVQEMLADMTMWIEAMRTLVVKTAIMADMERAYRLKLEHMAADDPRRTGLVAEHGYWLRMLYMFTPMAKYWCTEQSIPITSMAIQVMGGNGYTKDYPAERYYRDARVTPIYEGTTEIQVLFAMKSLIRGGEISRYIEAIDAFCEAGDGQTETEESTDSGGGDFEYSMDYGHDDDDEGGQELTIHAMLKECKNWLVDAGQILLGDFMDTRSDAYLRLRSRDIAELGIITFAGYEMLTQGALSPRKRLLAERWIRNYHPRAQALHARIESMDTSTVDNFEAIVYGKN
ncbi:acyl-CoA dehydrogenase family protein [bacterium]|nr:acyl-CoA dehydrogenase family protein [candidate division CSSED10-310 bacterium]